MCRKCGKNIEAEEIFRTSTCPFCGADLHSCVNCTYYSLGSHFDCHETVDELVLDKERSNFCDSFFVKRIFESSSSANDKANSARNAFNALFGN